MLTTIDRAGRVVIPKALRNQFNLGANAQVELVADRDGIRLRVPRREATFVEKDGVLVQAAEAAAPIDISVFINRLREGRALDNAGAPPRP